jgi:hypothetical protein
MDEPIVGIPVSLAREIAELGRKLVPYLVAPPEEPNPAAAMASAPPDVTTAVAWTGQPPWTRAEIELIRPEMKRLRGAVALLDLAAEHADEVVTYSQVIKRSGLERNELRAQLSAMTKAIRRALGSKAKWPLHAWQDAATGEMHYRMAGQIAEWWKGA